MKFSRAIAVFLLALISLQATMAMARMVMHGCAQHATTPQTELAAPAAPTAVTDSALEAAPHLDCNSCAACCLGTGLSGIPAGLLALALKSPLVATESRAASSVTPERPTPPPRRD